MDFIYERVESVEHALKLKAGYGKGGVFMAGGTDVLVDIRNGILKPKALIDISCLDELSYIRQQDGQIRVGSGTGIAEIQKSPIIQSHAAVLFKACDRFANPLIKNRATLGGNLICASPAADMAPPLLVLEAEVVLRSSRGERILPIEELFCGVKQTAQRDDELLTEVRFNQAREKKSEFLKLGLRNGTCLSIVSLAMTCNVAGGVITEPRIALGSVAPSPLRARSTERVLSNAEPTVANIGRAGDTVKGEVKPITDIRGSAEYRRQMSAALLLMAFQNLGYAQ